MPLPPHRALHGLGSVLRRDPSRSRRARRTRVMRRWWAMRSSTAPIVRSMRQFSACLPSRRRHHPPLTRRRCPCEFFSRHHARYILGRVRSPALHRPYPDRVTLLDEQGPLRPARGISQCWAPAWLSGAIRADNRSRHADHDASEYWCRAGHDCVVVLVRIPGRIRSVGSAAACAGNSATARWRSRPTGETALLFQAGRSGAHTRADRGPDAAIIARCTRR